MADGHALTHDEQTRTARFVKFLRGAVAIKSKPTLEVQQCPEVIWFSKLPAELKELRSALFTAEWPETDPRWLRVDRVSEPPRPVPPRECAPWLSEVNLDDPGMPPSLNPQFEGRDQEGNPVTVPVTVEAQDTWNRYVAREWSPWAGKASVARAVGPAYSKLFAIHQQMQGHADNFDLFVGVGLLDSRLDGAARVRRHLLAFPGEIVLDDRTGALTLGPAADFVAARVEVDFLLANQRANVERKAAELQPDLAALAAGLRDRGPLADVLRRLAMPFSDRADYVDSLEPAEAPASGARVSLGAAVVFRNRSTRSLDALLKRIEEATSGPNPAVSLDQLPGPWRKMMEDRRLYDEAAQGGGERRGSGNGRVYFPLPSNAEQSRIVQQAEGSPGVVVQGPPGTGKSHTIANLIAHYLATGRRVLVTAQTAQALEVLKGKLPADLQPLCVTLLGDSRVSDRDLRRSVEGILAQRQRFDPGASERRIAELETDLAQSEVTIDRHDRTLHQARATETEKVEPVPGYEGTRAAIARRLRDERDRLGWVPDVVSHHTACPTYTRGWNELAAYHRALGVELKARLAYEWVAPPFDPEAARTAAAVIVQAKAAISNGPPPSAGAPPVSADASSLTAAATWLRSLQGLEATTAPDDELWVSELRSTLLRNIASWTQLLDECRSTLAPLTEDAIASVVKIEVTGRSRTEAHRDLVSLDAHYQQGGQRRMLAVFKPAVVKETEWLETAVSVGGAPVRHPEDIARARRALDGQVLLDSGWAPWAKWSTALVGTPKAQAAALKQRARMLERWLATAKAAAEIHDDLRRWLGERLSARCPSDDLLASVMRALADLSLAEARRRRDELVVKLRQAVAGKNVVPSVLALIDGLLTENQTAVAAALAGMDEEFIIRERHRGYADFLEQLRTVAPQLANAVAADEGTDAWGPRFGQFEAAWSHRRVQTWLDVMLSSELIEAIHRAAKDERQRQQELLAGLTVAKAWREGLGRIDERRRATLTAWSKAVARIPGTGPNVFSRRAEAQALLGGCLDAIPAWVVSLGRLYETVTPEPGLFDVAIVDEASQCWLDSLVLFYLAKQVIIVGDDKQISPTIVGAQDAEITALRTTHLEDFGFRASYHLETSLFDIGQVHLPASVPLREHFRCVPEIIGFSNHLCYEANPLIPLRQVARDRLEPLKRTFVDIGHRTGDINSPEADAIVDAIATCHEDPAYEDMEFGVICLQGDKQGVHIEQKLLTRLGHEIFTSRKLRCGNPYVFQGDERDVMFLSMVAAPNARNATLSIDDKRFVQRFNVAMSRAREQAWLFHSIQEDELGPNCLRRRVLEYFKHPPDTRINGSSLDVPHLQLRAERADRRAEGAPRPFDSWFEVDVALALVARGYTLSAQVEVAGKRIDLVVEGDDGQRLAVECDGEAWHGADRYMADLARQRQLERSEWTFVRVRESLFYSDEGRAIQHVVDACEEMGIERGGRRREEGEGPAEKEARVDAADIASTAPSLDEPFAGFGEDDEPEEAVDESGKEASDPLVLAGDRASPIDGPLDRDYPDPRVAPPANVREAVLDIVRTDGPVTKRAIYGLYRDGCPRVARAGKHLRHGVNVALASLQRAGKIEERDEGRRRLLDEVVYRCPDLPWIVRRRGEGRSLADVPLSELAAAIWAELTPERADGAQLDALLKSVAGSYGVLRFTEQARARMHAAAEIAMNPARAAELGVLDFGSGQAPLFT